MSDITHNDPLVTESKLTEFYNDIKPFLGCPAYVTQEGDAEYYSTDEKVVGRWIDGKPLYQKSYIITRSSTGNINASLDIANLEKIYNITGAIRDNNNNTIDIGYCNQENIWIDSIVIHIDTGSSLGTYYITLQYTKTTDSASTTIEQKSTHYSTDEQIVGTWIDGKPVYQKVIQIDGLNITNYGGIDLSTYIPNIGDIVEESHTYYHNNMWAHDYYYTDSDRKSINVYILNGELKAEVIAKGAAVTKVRFIIKYTKTTD